MELLHLYTTTNEKEAGCIHTTEIYFSVINHSLKKKIEDFV